VLDHFPRQSGRRADRPCTAGTARAGCNGDRCACSSRWRRGSSVAPDLSAARGDRAIGRCLSAYGRQAEPLSTVALSAWGVAGACPALAGLDCNPRRGRIEAVGLLRSCASPLMIGHRLVHSDQPVAALLALALPVTALRQALNGPLPFALRILGAPSARHGFSLRQAGANCWGCAVAALALADHATRCARRSDLPAVTGALRWAILGVMPCSLDPWNSATLPLQMYGLMGAYGWRARAGAALDFLLALSLGVFWGFRQGRALACLTLGDRRRFTQGSFAFARRPDHCARAKPMPVIRPLGGRGKIDPSGGALRILYR